MKFTPNPTNMIDSFEVLVDFSFASQNGDRTAKVPVWMVVLRELFVAEKKRNVATSHCNPSKFT